MLALAGLVTANQINFNPKSLSKKISLFQLDFPGDCSLKEGKTNKNKFIIDKLRETYSISLIGLKKIKIFENQYSRRYKNRREMMFGIKFYYLNGDKLSYGNTMINKNIASINLEEKEIKDIILYYRGMKNDEVLSLQFQIYDALRNTLTWTPTSYYSSKYEKLSEQESFAINNTIILTKLNFFSHVNNLIQVEYSYCLKERAATTSKKTTQVTRSTTTSTTTRLTLLKCLVEERLSDLYGSSLVNGHWKYGRKFFINLATLKKIEIYHGRIVNGFKFFYKNGDQKSYGFTRHKKTNYEKNKMISIDLVNKEIVSVRVNHGYWVNTLQFEIYDHLTKETTWSKMMPGQSYFATDTTLDASQFVINKESFKINTLIGEIDKSDKLFGDFLQSLQFEYSVCLNDVRPETISIATFSQSTKKENTLKSSTPIILDISTPTPDEMRQDTESLDAKINLKAETLNGTIGLVKTEQSDPTVFMPTVIETKKITTSEETTEPITSNKPETTNKEILNFTVI
jgi:hypothetical protein